MPQASDETTIPTELVEMLLKARSVVVLTGSGVSAESGVPTFRDAQTGLWANYNPHDLATPAAFQHNPRLVWEWYAWRRQLISRAVPNPAHTALVDLERLVENFQLITQNIDSLHQKAGSRAVLELHGNINRAKCTRDGQTFSPWNETEAFPLYCPSCDGLLRPDVVWFGEALPRETMANALLATEACDLFFSIGTSAVVQPAASLSDYAGWAGAKIIEINPNSTPLTPFADFVLRGPAGSIIALLISSTFYK